MLTDSQVQRFNRDGFLLGDIVLSDQEVEELREDLERVIRDKDDEKVKQPLVVRNLIEDETPIYQIVNIWQASDAFRRAMEKTDIVSDVGQLTEAKELRIWHDQIQYKPKDNGGVNSWHQDNPLWPILDKPTQVTAWIALDDVDESNGCMRMVPGSHLWGDQKEYLQELESLDDMPAEFEDHDVEVVFRPVKKGQVHYHHSLTWHGSHANTSGRPRRAIAFHYMTEETCYNEEGEHLCKDLVESGLTDGEKLKGEHFPQVL